ncbi:hypothetical protein P3S68_021387 [Capsicum galapagoense]
MSGNLQVKRSVTKLRSLLTFGIADPQSLSCISQVLENGILDLSYMSSPPPLLQHLYLTGHIVKLPK